MESTYRDLNSPLNSLQKRRICKSLACYLSELGSRLLPLPVSLLVVFTLPFVLADVMAANIVSDFTVPNVENRCYAPQPEANRKDAFVVKFLVHVAFHLAIPVAGWLSETKIGRKASLALALWAGWLGALLQTFSESFQYHSCSIFELIGKYGFSSLALVFLVPSFTLYYAIVLAYGMDLLVGSCNVSKHRSFVYWFAWMYFLSGDTFSITNYLSGLEYSNSRLSIAFISFTFFSLSLSLHFFISWGVSITDNPYRNVCRILKNAMCWRNSTKPSRLDHCKRKHGGQYSHADVENVKKILRMVLILVALVPFWVSLDYVTDQVTLLVPQFNTGSTNPAIAQFIIVYIGKGTILLAVPLTELLLPIFPNVEYLLTTNCLRGLGLAQILLNIAIILTIAIDVTMRSINTHVRCLADWMPDDDYGFSQSYLVLLLPSIFSGVAENISFVCVLEFIYYHCPNEMIGMLICLFWVMRLCSGSISSILSFSLESWNPAREDVLCSSWLLIAIGIISLAGLFLYVLVVRWYMGKVLVDEQNDGAVDVEDHFEQQMNEETEENMIADSQF